MAKKKTQLEFTPTNCWQAYASDSRRRAVDRLAAGYMEFISVCKTERQVVAWVREQALAAGFSEDFKDAACLRVNRDKNIFLARKGRAGLDQGFRFIGAHADAPRIDLKQRPLYEEVGLGLAKTHYYGGIRKYQWLARPLALHGVVVKKDGRAVAVCVGEDPKGPVLTIADLLPHLAYKEVEKKVREAFEAEKMNAILGHVPAAAPAKGKANNLVRRGVLELLNRDYGLVEEDLYSAELELVPAGPARSVGLDAALIGGYGQDDRACVFTALSAMLAEKRPAHAQVLLFYDKEETGSDGVTGAKSMFFEYCLEDLSEAWGAGAKLSSIFNASQAISADVHPAVDPDYQDVHEKLNAAYLGNGPVMCKFGGHRGKYGTSEAQAEYVAGLRRLLAEAKVPWQMAELGKVDAGGGGTVAKFLAVYGMDVIDMGPPVLSMHSPFELTSKVDVYATLLAFRAFLRS
ncbi:MAG: aminopeptidase [Desulfovibrionaceae bacterium]|nr:aminopeptidase [Desulfovibrionaceae bacterium]